MTTPMQDAAGLIREHLWQGGMPESPDAKPWTMARELSIWKILAKRFPPDELNGAISVARELKSSLASGQDRVSPWQDRPISMRVFYWRTPDGLDATPFLHECISLWRQRQRDEPTRLPPSIRSVLGQMAKVIAVLFMAGCMVNGVDVLGPSDPLYSAVCVDSTVVDTTSVCYSGETATIIVIVTPPPVGRAEDAQEGEDD